MTFIMLPVFVGEVHIMCVPACHTVCTTGEIGIDRITVSEPQSDKACHNCSTSRCLQGVAHPVSIAVLC